VLLGGFGFALAYGPLNIAATSGVAAHEQGLASGLVNTSFQFGGAFVLAVATAVMNANTGADGSAQGVIDGFQAAVIVSMIAATLGALVSTLRTRRRPEPVAAAEPEFDDVAELEPEADAA
jgi:sugar phosphate permease